MVLCSMIDSPSEVVTPGARNVKSNIRNIRLKGKHFKQWYLALMMSLPSVVVISGAGRKSMKYKVERNSNKTGNDEKYVKLK